MKIHNGFTLIEVMITLCIIGIISSLATPAFKSLIEKHKADTTVFTLLHHLQYARTEAITKNKTISICATGNSISCSEENDWSNNSMMIFIDNNRNGLRDVSEIVLKIHNFNLSKNTLSWQSFGNKKYLQWQPNGMIYFQNGNFKYCPSSNNLKNAKQIILNSVGRIYIGRDSNKDGIQEGADGKNIICEKSKA